MSVPTKSSGLHRHTIEEKIIGDLHFRTRLYRERINNRHSKARLAMTG